MPKQTDVTIRPTGSYEIQYSTKDDRSNPQDLDGALVSGVIYVFVTPTTDISSVTFFQSSTLSGASYRSDSAAPYDLEGGTTQALPTDTSLYDDEFVTITAVITQTNGNIITLPAQFRIIDPVSPAPVAVTTGVETPTVSALTTQSTLVTPQAIVAAGFLPSPSVIPGSAITFKQGAYTGGVSSNLSFWFRTQTQTTPHAGMTYTNPPPNLMDPSFLNDWMAWLAADSRRLFILSISPIPASIARQWTNTTYDPNHTALANSLLNSGLTSRMILRIGWEMNGTWFPWGAINNNDPVTSGAADGFITMFRRIATIYKTICPLARINWCPNGFLANTGSWYPGDSYVDIVGMDIYDKAYYVSPNTPANRWTNGTLPYLQRQVAFAVAHSKPCALDEWGCWKANVEDGFGDNPYFVDHMHDWFVTNPYVDATYFNSTQGGVGITLTNGSCPNALAEYTSNFAGHTA